MNNRNIFAEKLLHLMDFSSLVVKIIAFGDITVEESSLIFFEGFSVKSHATFEKLIHIHLQVLIKTFFV